MSQDQDPIDETRRFEPVDPYNIPAEQTGSPVPGYEGYQPGFEQPQPGPPQGFKQRLTRLGPLKLAVLGTAGVIVLGGAAWGTTAALQSSGSSPSAAASAPTTSQSPGAGATTGKSGHHAKAGKSAKVKITQFAANGTSGVISGTDAKGASVTVTFDANTKFGTKKKPLKPEQLTAGKQISVAGGRVADKITATSITLVDAKTDKT